jgi:hypothetical protein
MELHTDEAVDIYIVGGERYNPLTGCILLDYMYAGAFDTLLIDITYEKGRHFKRTPLGITDAKFNFWRLCRRYLYPTNSEVGCWLRDLMRHCIVFKELLSIDAGPMLNPQVMIQGLHELSSKDGVIRQFDLDSAMATYAGLLSGGNLRACMGFVLSFVNDNQNHGSITWRNLELIKVLYRHIRHTVVAMVEAHRNLENPEDMIDLEKSQQYKDAFYNDDFGNANENPFMRYPSTLVAIAAVDDFEGRIYQQFTNQNSDDLYDFVNEPNLSTEQKQARYSDVQNILLYSNVRGDMAGNIVGLGHAVDFFGRSLTMPKSMYKDPDNPAKYFPIFDIEYTDQDRMELNNYQLIQKTIARESIHEEIETPVGFGKTESEMSFEAWTPDDPAATKKGTPGETIAVKKASPADAKAKEEGKQNTFFLIAIVAFVAAAFWSTN